MSELKVICQLQHVHKMSTFFTLNKYSFVQCASG